MAVRFENARAVLFDGQANTLRVLRETLTIIGFRKIEAHQSLDSTRLAIAEAAPELLILDLDDERPAVISLMREIRLRRMGDNPFLVVIGTTWDGDKKSVSGVLNAGADDLLLKPLSVDFVQSRLMNQIDKRKPFVATPNYIGPDRRTVRGGKAGEVPLLEVPNSLQNSVGDGPTMSKEALEAAAAKAYRGVGVQQAARFGVHVRAVAERLADPTAEDKGQVRVPSLEQLADMLEALRSQFQAQAFGDLVVLLDSARDLLNDFVGKTLTPKQIEVLRLHGEGILATLRGNDELPETGSRGGNPGRGRTQSRERVGRYGRAWPVPRTTYL